MSMISTVGNFLPKKAVVAGGGGSTNTNPPNIAQLATTILSTRYFGVAVSETGKYMVVCIALTTNQPNSAVLYVSSNFGSSFSQISGFSTTGNADCSISKTGQYMVMVVSGGYMYRSVNYGVNWAQVSNISTPQNWSTVSLSANGAYCLANGNYTTHNLYISSNFNTTTPTFAQVSVYTNMSTNVSKFNSVSETGQNMVLVNYGITNGIAISNNYGTSFTKLTWNNIGVTGTGVYYINMTPDSNTVYCCVYNNGLYKSTNLWSGSPSFTKINSATFTEQTWNCVAISSDGTYIVASTDAKTYYSTNSGATWTLAYTGKIFQSAMSYDGHYFIGISYNVNQRLLFSNT